MGRFLRSQSAVGFGLAGARAIGFWPRGSEPQFCVQVGGDAG